MALLAAVAAAALAAGCGGAPARHRTAGRRSPPPPAAHTASAPAPRAVVVPTGPRHAPVAILMYHVVAAAPPGTPYPELWVAPGRFGAQMRALAHAGYHAT